MVNTQHFKRLLALITIQSRILAEGETACLSYLSIQQWLAIVTYDLCFVPAVASVHISWLENQSVSYHSYLVITFGNFSIWAHKHVFNTRWHLILFLLLLYSREEKNVALQALRDELLASKKSLESLIFLFIYFFYFICHTNYKKYRKRRKKKRSGEET